MALRQGMEVLGLGDIELDQMPKSAPAKRVLAWWLRRRTTVSLRWLSQRLAMGHFTRVSQAISQVNRRSERGHERIKRRLLETTAMAGSDNQSHAMQRL